MYFKTRPFCFCWIRSNDFTATWREARQARADDIEMVAVGVGNNLNMLELETIASSSGDGASNILHVDGFATLDPTVTAAVDMICNSTANCLQIYDVIDDSLQETQ